MQIHFTVLYSNFAFVTSWAIYSHMLHARFARLSLLHCSRTFSDSNYTISKRTDLTYTLKLWRKRTSDELQIPIYRVLSNKVLDSIVEKRPKTLLEFNQLSGIGFHKTEKFGPTIINIISNFESGKLDNMDLQAELSSEDQKYLNDAIASMENKRTFKKRKKTIKSKTDGRIHSIEILSGEEGSRHLSSLDSPIRFDDLNSEQQFAAESALCGKNVFITGSAGTGKSFLTRYVVQELIKQHGVECVAVTAPTGIAAINVGGQTINRLELASIADYFVYAHIL